MNTVLKIEDKKAIGFFEKRAIENCLNDFFGNDPRELAGKLSNYYDLSSFNIGSSGSHVWIHNTEEKRIAIIYFR